MTDITIRIGIDQIVDIGELHMDKITEVVQGMNKAIGMTLEEEILEVKGECIKIRIVGDRIIEVHTEETIGMKIMKEVGVGLEKGNIKVAQEGMIEDAVVGHGHDQEQVLIQTE